MLAYGIDRIEETPDLLANLGRIGIVTTQAVTNRRFVPVAEVLKAAVARTSGSRITRVFGPQHGYGQTEQDNMIETADGSYPFGDGESVPLLSVYSSDLDDLFARLREGVDTLIVDLQDIGCRVYTYMQTLALCLKAFHGQDKRIIVLDRPNPLGLMTRDRASRQWLRVEGNPLESRWDSLVGWFSIPMRHGLTLGELGKWYVREHRLDVDFDVFAVQGLRRDTAPVELSREPWTLPSPNIPSWLSAWFFPVFVVLEATNISEGRGSTQPFQVVGAPWFRNRDCAAFLQRNVRGTGRTPEHDWFCRPHDFRPTFNKNAGRACRGLGFHAYAPFETNLFELGMNFLHFAVAAHPGAFEWAPPGYEYNMTDERLPLILGSDVWSRHFATCAKDGLTPDTAHALQEILAWAHATAQKFADSSEGVHIYPE